MLFACCTQKLVWLSILGHHYFSSCIKLVDDFKFSRQLSYKGMNSWCKVTILIHWENPGKYFIKLDHFLSIFFIHFQASDMGTIWNISELRKPDMTKYRKIYEKGTEINLKTSKSDLILCNLVRYFPGHFQINCSSLGDASVLKLNYPVIDHLLLKWLLFYSLLQV